MFKGRIGLWVGLFITCLLTQLAITWVPTWFNTYETPIMINIYSDPNMAEFVTGQKIDDFQMILNNTNPTVIISSEKIDDENYVEYENCLTSPLVLFASAEILNGRNEGFIGYSSGKVFQIELYSLLEAMENGTTFDSLGFNKHTINGPVVLHIPSESAPYYNEVVDLFYLTLNFGRTPTTEQKEALKPRVEKLLSKCVKVADIRQAIKDEASSPSDTKKFFIAPEYLHQTSAGMFHPGSGSYKQYMPVYFNNTIYLTANMYLRNTENGLVSIGKWFLENIQENQLFAQKTGWRIANHTYPISYVSTVYMENP